MDENPYQSPETIPPKEKPRGILWWAGLTIVACSLLSVPLVILGCDSPGLSETGGDRIMVYFLGMGPTTGLTATGHLFEETGRWIYRPVIWATQPFPSLRNMIGTATIRSGGSLTGFSYATVGRKPDVVRGLSRSLPGRFRIEAHPASSREIVHKSFGIGAKGLKHDSDTIAVLTRTQILARGSVSDRIFGTWPTFSAENFRSSALRPSSSYIFVKTP